MTQLALWGRDDLDTPPARPEATDAQLMVLVDVAWIVDHGCYSDPGAPILGMRKRTVTSCADRGWLTLVHLGDSDIDGGPRRAVITAAGREQLALADAWCDHHGWTRYADLLGYAREEAS